MKTNIEKHKRAWGDQLLFVLWFYRTMYTTTTREIPYSLTFGMKAVVPVEIRMPLYIVEHFQLEQNNEQLNLNLDLLEERKEQASSELQSISKGQLYILIQK